MSQLIPTSWQNLEGQAQGRWQSVALGGGLNYLMQWADIQFQVQPLNYHEMDHETGTDWAHKEIAGAAIYREWVGENDETIYLRGNLFPYRIGGMPQIEKFNSYRQSGMANLLVRGDGRVMGWFVCEKLIRTHTSISFEGVGQQIAFEAVMARVPIPDSDTYLTMMWAAGGP
jgi:phage protein U